MITIVRFKMFVCLVLIITSFAVASEKNSTVDHIPLNVAMNSYIEIIKDNINSIVLYGKRIWNQVMSSGFDFFTTYGVIPLSSAHNVIIQILGKKQPVDSVEDENLRDEQDDQDDICPVGNEICQKNLNFFNSTFFSGLLNLNDQDPADIDRRDNEYKKMRMQQLKLLYGEDASHESQEFSYNK